MADRYWVPTGTNVWDTLTTANWSATSGGAGGASVPTAADDVYFDSNSGSAAIKANYGSGSWWARGRPCKNLFINGFAGAIGGGVSVNGTTVSITGLTNTHTDIPLQVLIFSTGASLTLTDDSVLPLVSFEISISGAAPIINLTATRLYGFGVYYDGYTGSPGAGSICTIKPTKPIFLGWPEGVASATFPFLYFQGNDGNLWFDPQLMPNPSDFIFTLDAVPASYTADSFWNNSGPMGAAYPGLFTSFSSFDYHHSFGVFAASTLDHLLVGITDHNVQHVAEGQFPYGAPAGAANINPTYGSFVIVPVWLGATGGGTTGHAHIS